MKVKNKAPGTLVGAFTLGVVGGLFAVGMVGAFPQTNVFRHVFGPLKSATAPKPTT